MFAVRQLQEKCQEHIKDLYTTFVDLTKAFNTVSREGLWKIMAKFGFPNKFIKMVSSSMLECKLGSRAAMRQLSLSLSIAG